MGLPHSRVPSHLRTDPPEEFLRALPPRLLEAVFIAGNGEVFWPEPVAIEAARWLAARNLAIVGGEVYVPRSPAWGVFMRCWDTSTMPDEGRGWGAQVALGLEHALREIAAGFGDAQVDGEVSDLHFFLAWREPE